VRLYGFEAREEESEALLATASLVCHRRGLWPLFPEVRTIIDIGGQDTKAIALNDKGEVERFLMNDQFDHDQHRR